MPFVFNRRFHAYTFFSSLLVGLVGFAGLYPCLNDFVEVVNPVLWVAPLVGVAYAAGQAVHVIAMSYRVREVRWLWRRIHSDESQLDGKQVDGGFWDHFMSHRRLFAKAIERNGDSAHSLVNKTVLDKFWETVEEALADGGEVDGVDAYLYPYVVSQVRTSRGAFASYLQGVYSFHRSMALLSFGLALFYVVGLIVGTPSGQYPPPTFCTTEYSLPLAGVFAASFVVFLFGTLTYMRHYVQYLISDYANLAVGTSGATGGDADGESPGESPVEGLAEEATAPDGGGPPTL